MEKDLERVGLIYEKVCVEMQKLESYNFTVVAVRLNESDYDLMVADLKDRDTKYSSLLGDRVDFEKPGDLKLFGLPVFYDDVEKIRLEVQL